MVFKNKQLAESYVELYKKYGVNHKSLKWSGRGAAHQRFRHLLGELNLDGKSILDVGCGFGDVVPFVEKNIRLNRRLARNIDTSTEGAYKYTGVDVVTEFVAEAKKLHPEHEFIQMNYFESPLERVFDVVLCSGALNSDMGGRNYEFRRDAIKTMFNRCRLVLAFNMASNLANPLKILEYCLSLTPRVIFMQHYHRQDFTVLMFKKTKGVLFRKK